MVQARPKLNQQIYEEATEWLIRHRSGTLDAADKNAFDAWLRRSPEHVRAYFEMSAVWEDAGSIDRSSTAPAAELIDRASRGGAIMQMPEIRNSAAAKALSSGHDREPAVIGLGPRRRANRYRIGFATAVAATCAALALVGRWLYEPSYSTGIAEQRSITLADGSTVELNARSAIRVRFVAHERDIDLVRGQALFRVAKDPARPFMVRAGDTVVRAVGTQFDVNELSGGTIVTVVEGLVAVLGPPRSLGTGAVPSSDDAIPSREHVAAELIKGLSGTTRPIFLGSGEQLTVTAKRLQEAAHVDVATATAWTQHQFAFDAAPLSEVVDEFNRYNARQLVIADPQLDDMRVNGLFSSTNPALLLQFLRNQPEISVEDIDDEIRISKK
ncbi:MAG TPA: FecR family protein [Steroidobacteraceae bacterium]|nr:FecR family protein [Steroidobacteraceae bacterium]